MPPQMTVNLTMKCKSTLYTTVVATYPAPLAGDPFGALLDVARFLTFRSNASAGLIRDFVFSAVALFSADDHPFSDATSAGFGTRSPLIGDPSESGTTHGANETN